MLLVLEKSILPMSEVPMYFGQCRNCTLKLIFKFIAITLCRRAHQAHLTSLRVRLKIPTLISLSHSSARPRSQILEGRGLLAVKHENL